MFTLLQSGHSWVWFTEHRSPVLWFSSWLRLSYDGAYLQDLFLTLEEIRKVLRKQKNSRNISRKFCKLGLCRVSQRYDQVKNRTYWWSEISCPTSRPTNFLLIMMIYCDWQHLAANGSRLEEGSIGYQNTLLTTLVIKLIIWLVYVYIYILICLFLIHVFCTVVSPLLSSVTPSFFLSKLRTFLFLKSYSP